MPDVKILPAPPEPPRNITPLPGPVVYELVTDRPLVIDGHDIAAGEVVGEFVCKLGLDIGWLHNSMFRHVSAELKK